MDEGRGGEEERSRGREEGAEGEGWDHVHEEKMQKRAKCEQGRRRGGSVREEVVNRAEAAAARSPRGRAAGFLRWMCA